MDFFEYAQKAFENFTFADAAEIIVFAALVYVFALWVKKAQANWYNKFLFAALTLCFVLSAFLPSFGRAFLADAVVTIILSTVIIFAQDIKRGIWKRSRIQTQGGAAPAVKVSYTEEELRELAAEVVKAAQNMAKTHTGALMVFTRSAMPAQIVDSGVSVDAAISSQIIETVFFHNTALHDGAMIFGSYRIIAAGCFLPLSAELSIPKELGTRHRAAIGISETLPDLLSLVVSEETGIISAAYQGKLVRYLDNEQLTETVGAAFGLSEFSALSMFKENKNGEDLL